MAQTFTLLGGRRQGAVRQGLSRILVALVAAGYQSAAVIVIDEAGASCRHRHDTCFGLD